MYLADEQFILGILENNVLYAVDFQIFLYLKSEVNFLSDNNWMLDISFNKSNKRLFGKGKANRKDKF